MKISRIVSIARNTVLKVRLRNRIYPDNEPIPLDHDNWLQCYECGTKVPVYEIEKEASIKDVIETVDNPFDIAKNSFLGVDSRASTKKRKRQRDRERELDEIKDDEVKRELSKGNTLISYFEYQPQ
jgi:hypothetical protein